MKRTLCLLLIWVMLVSLTACGGAKQPSKLVELDKYAELSRNGTDSIEVSYTYSKNHSTELYEFVIDDEETVSAIMKELFRMELAEYPKDIAYSILPCSITVIQGEREFNIDLFSVSQGRNHYLCRSGDLCSLIEDYIDQMILGYPVPTIPETQPRPEQTLPPATQPAETEPSLTVITDAIGLRDYLRSREEAGQTHFSFRFTATTVDVSPQNIARVGGYFYVHRQVEGDLCSVQVVEYPGERIVKAWTTDNDADLSQEEREALEIALNLVSQAKQVSSTELELEKNLFDLFRTHVTYNNGSTAIPDPDTPPRYLTAVGALVDGSANCQGYADGFYVLASLAGFTVERMHVDIPEGGHTVNVIRLDGAWYVVDATFNDLDHPSQVQISYCLMNVGKDKCLRYSWGEDVERYPIPQATDHHFYYYQPGEQHRRCFDSVEAIAQRVVDDWRVYGTGEFRVMLEGNIATWQELEEAITRIAADYGLTLAPGIWYEHNVSDTYFYISLS